MNKNEVILIVVSTLGTALAFSLPLVTLLWRVFSLTSELRMQIAENRNSLVILTNKVDHLDERWDSATHQTLEKFNHFSNRFRGEVNVLSSQVREVQNYLSKTTDFEVRSQGN